MCLFVRLWLVFIFVVIIGVMPAAAQGQPPPDPHAQHRQPAPPDAQHVHPGPDDAMMFAARDASGTAWLPDATPMYGVLQNAGAWRVMWHGTAFVQYLHETGERGSHQTGSINWVMGMARRDLGGGWFGVRGMASLEPWTIRGCGYPDLLATGEVCEGGSIHDRQHPHDLFMEVAAEYNRALSPTVRWQVYGGLAGEPALGPVAYPHRLSAMPNPLAPISHHWVDATHITFGVVTAGVYGRRWKVEGSSFNGREPDDQRRDLDLAALDSFSGRVWFLPTSSLAFQVSAGYLNEAEAADDGGPRADVSRMTASATYHRAMEGESIWATTVAWGRNSEAGRASNAFLAETNLTLREQHAWFGRLEVAGKAAHDLDVPGADEVFTVAKLQAGYTRYFKAWHGLKPGIGGSVSAGVVPQTIEPVYGNRLNTGFGIFVTLRPAAHVM